MIIRAKALQAATALLYLGPLLAGLFGFGAALLTIFALIFTLRLMILRPELYPQAFGDWLILPVQLELLLQSLAQLLLIAALISIGRGFGGLLDLAPRMHALLPVAASLAAILLTALLTRGDLMPGAAVRDQPTPRR